MFKLFKKRNTNADERGFTLVEMIVALGIFAVVALVAVGALTKIIDANRKSQTLKSAINNISFALESMSREIRLGTNYDCEVSSSGWTSVSLTKKNCPVSGGSSGQLLAFKSSKPDPSDPSCNLIFAYRFNNTDKTLEKAEQKSCTDIIDEGSGSGHANFSPVTSVKVKINSYKLFVSEDSKYPLVYIRVNASAGDRIKDETTVDVQTTISPRLMQ